MDRLPKILLVDDNVVNNEITMLYLENHFKTDVATSGRTAVSLAEANKYDAIIMDLKLGGDMDGIETANRIRTYEMNEATPIVAITGFSVNDQKERIRDAGIEEVIEKPFEKDQIVGALRRVIKTEV